MPHEQIDIDLWAMAEAWRQQNGHEPAESPADVGVPAGHRAPDPSVVTAVPHAADVDHVQRLEADEPGDEQAAQSCALAPPDAPEPDTLDAAASPEPVTDPEPITPEPEADPSREHRFALEVHKTRLLAAELELEAVEARLSAPDCDDDESNVLLERRRKASDKLAWLRTRSEHLQFFANQESQMEMKVIANDAFEPLTQERHSLIREYESMANAIVALEARLRESTVQIHGVLDRCGRIDGFDHNAAQQAMISADKQRTAWLARRLGMVEAYPAISHSVPNISDPFYGEALTIAGRLFPIPRKA